MVELNLTLVLSQWARVGPGRLRSFWLKELAIRSVREEPNAVRISGTVTWQRGSRQGDKTVTEPFGLLCPVPSLIKTPKRVRPVLLFGDSAAEAA
jgi:hypothetical protein